jgi:hypothetical protein
MVFCFLKTAITTLSNINESIISGRAVISGMLGDGLGELVGAVDGFVVGLMVGSFVGLAV